ncbi:hypothetical protein LP7551_02484 [Roseibium album]|nr:hypothetical protein LP7551_02484 [Roseibium album]
MFSAFLLICKATRAQLELTFRYNISIFPELKLKIKFN